MRSLNDAALLNLTMIHTGATQTWQTYTAQAVLTTGTHKLRTATASANLGINWIEISAP